MLSKIIDNLRQNWITYLFEIIVVLLGILGAESLNDWNEVRKEKELEHNYLLRLKKDFEENLESVLSNKAVELARVDHAELVLDIAQHRSVHYDVKELAFAVETISFLTEISPDHGPQ